MHRYPNTIFLVWNPRRVKIVLLSIEQRAHFIMHSKRVADSTEEALIVYPWRRGFAVTNVSAISWAEVIILIS